MIYAIILTGLFSLGYGMMTTIPLRKKLTSMGMELRGFLKHYNAGELPQEFNHIVKRWFILVFLNFAISFILVIKLTWKTDYNFVIALFPFLWHYLIMRFFLWEKEDMT